jgi:TolB-like protein
MRKSLFSILLLVFCPLMIAQQTMNNDTVVKLVKAGLSDDIIITTINASPGAYDISADGLVALKSAGASNKVIAAIVTKSTGQTPQQAGEPTATTQEATKPSGSTPAAAPDNSAEGQPAQPESGTVSSSGVVPAGARVVIAPMGGFETYFAAAVREKKVPITLTLDRASAQFFVVSTDTQWEGFVYGSGGAANWNQSGGNASYGAAASSTRGLEASIMVIDAKTKDVVWAYEVHKNSHGSLLFGTLGARGQQSVAEACAKHLKEFIEKGK